MKLIFLIDFRLMKNSGGISGFFCPILDDFIQSRPDDTFYLLNNNEDQSSSFFDYPNVKVLEMIDFKRKWGKLGKIFNDFIYYPRVINKLNPHFFISPYYDLRIPFFYKGKALIFIHDLCYWDLPECYPLFTRLYYRLLAYLNIKKSTVVCTVSLDSKNKIHRKFSKVKNVEVVYNSFENNLINQTESFEKKYAGDYKYFVYSSGLEERKNIKTMLEAFSIFQKKHNQFKLIFTGPFEKNQYLISLIKDLKLTEHVILTGKLSFSELGYIYQNIAKAVINLSLYEGFGRSNLEAMSFGVPLVCSDISVFKEVLKEYPIYCNHLDLDDIVEKFEIVIKKDRCESVIDERFRLENNLMTFQKIIKQNLMEKS